MKALDPAIFSRLNRLGPVRDEGQHWCILSHMRVRLEKKQQCLKGINDNTETLKKYLQVSCLHISPPDWRTSQWSHGNRSAHTAPPLWSTARTQWPSTLDCLLSVTTRLVVKQEMVFYYVCACNYVCTYLDLLQQSLYDAQQDVPGHDLQLFAVLLDQSGDGEDDLVGHHLIGTWHGLMAEVRHQQSQIMLLIYLYDYQQNVDLAALNTHNYV